MASRRGRAADSSTEHNQSNTDNSTEEAPVTTESAEQTTTDEPTNESTESTTTESTEEKPAEVDLSAFTAAVESAVEDADETTGEVPEASLAKVTTAYRELDGLKAKNAAKKLVDERMKDAMNEGNLAAARANLQISDKALVAASKSGGGDKAPADPTENFVQRVATLSLGYSLASASVPEGVAENWAEKVQELVNESYGTAQSYLAWTQADPESRGEEPEVSAVIRNAAKLAQGKSAKAGVSRGGGTFTGERRDIGVHIVSAFEDKEVGAFLTIAEIRNHKSEEYGDNPPSAGAISARLFPRSGESSMPKFGIEPANEGGKKGARKVEVPGDEE